MGIEKLRGIKSVGAYTAQRSTLEHLLLLEEIILREMPKTIPSTKKILAQQLQQYKEQNKINNPFGIEDIQHYLLTTTEQELNREKSRVRGIYTSTLIEQIEGDSPITIDMEGRAIACLLYDINTPRNITINNTKGDWTGAYAGYNQGQANLTINNTRGEFTGAFAGSDHGKAQVTINNTEGNQTGAHSGREYGSARITINNTNGHYTGAFVGSDHGKAHIIINNTKGRNTGADAGSNQGTAHLIITNTEGDHTGESAGSNKGNAIIVAYNNQGREQFMNYRGILIFKNSETSPSITGIRNPETRAQIQKLIEKNASPEEVMNYALWKTW